MTKHHKTTLTIGIIFFLFSCSPTVDKKAANDYYFEIQTLSEKQDSSYQSFLNTFKRLVTKANENEGRRLDSSDMETLTSEYETFMNKLKLDLIQLQKLKEVDSEINLKYNAEKHISFVDSTLGDIMPKVFNYLKVSLDSVDQTFQDELAQLRTVVANEQTQRKEIENLSQKFRQKYPD